MKQFILFSALAVSVFSTGFTSEKKSPANSNQTVAAVINDFDFLRAHRQGKGITLTWGMISNTNLSGFDIEKTNEDPYDPYSVWEPVASLPGGNERSFKHKDPNALPGQTHYRVTAWYTDGRSSVSEIVTVKIVSH